MLLTKHASSVCDEWRRKFFESVVCLDVVLYKGYAPFGLAIFENIFKKILLQQCI